MTRKRIFYPLILLVVFAVIAAACGDDDEPTPTTAATTAAPTTGAATTAAPTTGGPSDTTAAPTTPAPTTTTPEVDPGDVVVAPDRVQDAETVVIAWTGFYNSLDPPDSLVTFNREAGVGLYDRLLTYELVELPQGRHEHRPVRPFGRRPLQELELSIEHDVGREEPKIA